MSVMLLTALALAQSAPLVAAPSHVLNTETPELEVGYRELAAGDASAAVARIEAHRGLRSDEPAVLINAGTAYARLGQFEKAKQAFRAAVRSNNRYELELADGRWMDSREAARLAIGRLEFASR